jgi:ABC-type antimicrobial peptide transport system permease subunit
LVIFQFTVTVVFIVGVMVVYEQMRYIQTSNPGYRRENVVNFDVAGITRANAEEFIAELKHIPAVLNASGMDHGGLFDYGTSVADWTGRNPNDVIQFSNIGIDYDMIGTLGLQIIKGRGFSRSLSSDSSEAVLNEAAVQAMGIKDPIGKKIELFNPDGYRTIVGIARNFHYQSLHEDVKPFALRLVTQYTQSMMVKIRSGQEKAALERIQELYKTFRPGVPFEYRFLDEDFQAQYIAEGRVAVLSRYFGGLAILISCLGLFGLAAYTAQRRYREIGIRKVLGATEGSVVFMLSRDLLKLILVAVVIAFPLAWWSTEQWLNNFAYRIRPGFSIFLIAGVLTIFITLLTISFQTIRAAIANPVKILRAE